MITWPFTHPGRKLSKNEFPTEFLTTDTALILHISLSSCVPLGCKPSQVALLARGCYTKTIHQVKTHFEWIFLFMGNFTHTHTHDPHSASHTAAKVCLHMASQERRQEVTGAVWVSDTHSHTPSVTHRYTQKGRQAGLCHHDLSFSQLWLSLAAAQTHTRTLSYCRNWTESVSLSKKRNKYLWYVFLMGAEPDWFSKVKSTNTECWKQTNALRKIFPKKKNNQAAEVAQGKADDTLKGKGQISKIKKSNSNTNQARPNCAHLHPEGAMCSNTILLYPLFYLR